MIFRQHKTVYNRKKEKIDPLTESLLQEVHFLLFMNSRLVNFLPSSSDFQKDYRIDENPDGSRQDDLFHV